MRPQVTVENPILNSPFAEPARHFRIDAHGKMTADILPGRRESAFYVPVTSPKKQPKKEAGLFDETEEERRVNVWVNNLRQEVKRWRELGHPDTTPTTQRLLRHWADPSTRARRLFFCQIEAVETLVYIAEVAKSSKDGNDRISTDLKGYAAEAGTTLFRMACKMATGAGKTAVMSMLIAWHTLNKRQNPRDARFTDSFLVVAPGITIKDRLRVLLPSDEGNYYKHLELVPRDMLADLGTARIVVTNFHAFQLRAKGEAGAFTKRILQAKVRPEDDPFVESSAEMVKRVCRDLATNRQIVVINDEAHHCYRGKLAAEKLTGDDKKEADLREEEARLWISGIESVDEHLGVKAVYDLSATPAYLKGSGYREGELFKWVVSDFSLVDAIESGIVKIPRVPVADNAMVGDWPKYRHLWMHVREGLPKKGRGDSDTSVNRVPPVLEGALRALYGHYRTGFEDWQADEEARADGPHSAGLHRRVQQHQYQQNGLRLDRRPRDRPFPPRRRSGSRPWQP